MSLAGIITEVDAYLERLTRARELLLASLAGEGRHNASRPKKKVKLSEPMPYRRSSARGKGNTSRSQRPLPRRLAIEERAYSASQGMNSVRREASAVGQRQIAASTSRPQSMRDTEAPFLTEPKSPAVSRGPGGSRQKPAAKPQKTRPAIAAASPMASRIVVVPADQVKQERERAAQPDTRPQRVPVTGLSGRRAFEALFKD